jgi:hypothetical protein
MIHSGLMLEKGQDGTGNTGDYAGYDIRVKGDGRVEAIDGQGRASMHRNVVDAKLWLDNPPPPAPVLTSIDPTSAEIGGADVTLTCTGSGFTEESVIVFNGSAEPTTFVSDTELTTIVKPSTASIVISVPVAIYQDSGRSGDQMFSFTEAAEE